MKVPVFFTGCCLIFWGLESNALLISIPLAILLESSNFTAKKWHLSQEDFIRISDFTSVIFLATIALILLNYGVFYFLKALVQWQPLIVLPLILAQLFSTNDKIIIGTRIGSKNRKAHVHQPMDFTVIYCGLCLFSAAVTNSRSDLFYPLFITLAAWIFFFNRGRAFAVPLFIVLTFLSTTLGYLGFQGGEKAHDYLSITLGRMIRGYYWSKYADPFQDSLSFGTLKNDKLSGQILMRMKADQRKPLLLRQASYDTWFPNRWKNTRSFEYLPISEQGWQLHPEPPPHGKRLAMELYLPKEKGLLPSPSGSYQVAGEHLFELGQNSAGIIKIIDAASLVDYEIHYDENLVFKEDTPHPSNLKIPEEEQATIDQIATELNLLALPPSRQVSTLVSFFASKFNYSLTITNHRDRSTLLGDFLLDHRQGYCEMFATATALLLRKAGTPSRYVTGFAAVEYSRLEDKFIIRKRHAHAWVEAYIDKRWVTIDTTPATWPESDREKSSFLEPVRDVFAFLKLHFDRFRIQTEQRYNLLLSLTIVLLTAFLGLRYYRRMQAKSLSETPEVPKKTFDQETPFSKVEEHLAKAGLPRGKSEPFLVWLERINRVHPLDMKATHQLYLLHQKLRFDPTEHTDKEYTQLLNGVTHWLNTTRIASPEEAAGKGLTPLDSNSV